MPAARRRLRRRIRRRYPLTRSRWHQYNVLRTKCEYVTQLLYPADQAGQPYLNNTTGGNRSYISIPEMMATYNRNTQLRSMFAYCMVSGFKIEVTPHSNNVSAAGISNQSPVCLALLPGTNGANAGLTFNDLSVVNTGMVLDSTQRQSRYWSWRGGQFDMKLAADNDAIAAGTLLVRSVTNGVYTQSPSWNVRVTLYVVWRYAKLV